LKSRQTISRAGFSVSKYFHADHIPAEIADEGYSWQVQIFPMSLTFARGMKIVTRTADPWGADGPALAAVRPAVVSKRTARRFAGRPLSCALSARIHKPSIARLTESTGGEFVPD